jgi:hypothetical protein
MTVSIHTVVDNLKNTIKGKEAYMARCQAKLVQRPVLSDDMWLATRATVDFLEININELKVILHDVEQCAEQFSLMSWEINPERMGQ